MVVARSMSLEQETCARSDTTRSSSVDNAWVLLNINTVNGEYPSVIRGYYGNLT